MKIKRIFLDNYDLCTKEEADLIIIPQSNKGIKTPEIYYKRKDPYWLIVDIDENTIWSTDIKLSTTLSQDAYNKCIDWWFDNIPDSFQKELLDIADVAISYGFDLAMSVDKAKNKLKLADKQHRKSNISKFLIDWVSVGCSRFIAKQKSNGVYA